MTTEAQNALLLTLEEPPSYAVFVLLCESANELLETIRSRAPIFRTELMSVTDIEKCVISMSDKARALKTQDPDLLSQILVSAGGTVGRALEYLDEKKFAPIKEARELTYGLLGAVANNEGAGKVIPLLSKFSSKRDALEFQLEMLHGAAIELIILKRSDARELTFFESSEKALELCDVISASKLFALCEAVTEAIDDNRSNANVRLLLMKMANNMKIL